MLEQVDLPLSEEQCSIDQVLSEECFNTEQSQLEITLLICQIKTKRKVSNQKTHEEYKQVKAKLGTKKQEFERRKERETQSLYKKKIEVFKILSKKL